MSSFGRLRKMLDPNSVVREGELTAEENDPGSVVREGELSNESPLSKLKEMLTGIPSDPAEQERVRKQNEQMAKDMLGASEARMTGRPMTAGEQSEDANTKRIAQEAMENAAGMMGGIKKVDKITPEMEAIAERARQMIARGERPPAASQIILNRVEGTPSKPIISLGEKVAEKARTIEAKPPTPKVIEEMAGAPKSKLPPKPVTEPVETAATTDIEDPKFLRYLSRKLTGGY